MPGYRKTDPLFRGDAVDAVWIPHPSADPSLVRHILYLGGYGRESPYLSTSADEVLAARFGRVWRTSGTKAEALGAKHLAQSELESILKASRSGRGHWKNARQRLMARKYVELHAEHLIDFSPFKSTPTAVGGAVRDMFEKV